MLRGRTVKHAALAALLLWASPVYATDPAIGTGCTPQGGGSARYDNGNNSWCNGSTWQYPFYVMGSAAASAGASCSGFSAGAMRYNTTLTNIEMCDGSNWRFLAAATTSCGSPSGLSFTNLTSRSLGVSVTSNTATITFSGCSGGGQAVSVTGAATAEISINGGAWGTAGSITSGQTLQVRMTTSGSVSTTLTATVTVGGSSTNWTTTTRAGSLQIFVTSGNYVGSGIGGLSAADGLCQSEAGSLGYAGTYKAILSDESTNAKDRVTLTYPIIRASDGATVSATNLWNGVLSNGIGSGGTWSGTNADGTKIAGGTCSGWSSAGTAAFANPAATDTTWLNYAGTGCDNAFHIYCIQQ